MKTQFRSIILTVLILLGNGHFCFSDYWQQPPKQFTDQGGGLSGATDGNGNAVAVWRDFSSLTVGASYYTQGAWGPTQVLSSNESFSSDVAMDATGKALAIWYEQASGAIRTALFSGGFWTTPSPDPLDTISVGVDNRVSIAMDGNGRGVAIWIDSATFTVRASLFNGISWSSPLTIGTGENLPAVAYSTNGTAVALWNDGGNVTASNFNGLIWLAPVVIGSTSNNFSSKINVGIDSSGNAHASWTDPANNVIVDSFIGNVWIPTQILGTIPIGGSTSLAVAPGGTAVLVFKDSSSNGQSSSYNGISWGPLQPFSLDGNVSSAGVSVDAAGNALVVWGTFGTDQVFSSELPLGGVWGNTLLVTNAPDNLTLVTSALSSGGRGFAFWEVQSEGTSPFASALFADPAAPTDLTGRVCKNAFASQIDRINIISWTPSTDSFVIFYQLSRNGVVIATIPAFGPYIYFDHNRSKNPDVYVLIAVSGAGLISVPIMIEL